MAYHKKKPTKPGQAKFKNKSAMAKKPKKRMASAPRRAARKKMGY